MINEEIVFDLETERAFSDLADRNNFGGLGVSVLGCYSYRDDKYYAFSADMLADFEELLKSARRVIGFNIRHFDYPVLQPHMKTLVLKDLPTLDLMLEPAQGLGFRPKLDDLAKATLGVQKSGHGLQAIEWYRAGQFDLLRQYCLDDVKITRDLLEFGIKNGHIMLEFRYAGDLRKIPVSWARLPFITAEVQHSLFT